LKRVRLNARSVDLTATTLKIYWAHVVVYWPFLLVWAIGMITVIGADIVSPLMYKNLFDLLATIPSKASRSILLLPLYHAIAYIALVMLVNWIGLHALNFAANSFGSLTIKDLTDSSFEYIQGHSYRLFTDNFAGSLVKRINRFATSFGVIADQCTSTTVQTAFRLVLIVGVVTWRNRVIGGVLLGWTIIFMLFNLFISKLKLEKDIQRAEIDSNLTGFLSDTFTNALAIKLFSGLEREVVGFKQRTDEYQRARWKSWTIGWYADGVQNISVRCLEVLVLVLAVFYWVKGMLTIGDFVLLRAYLLQLTFNISRMGSDIRAIYEAMAEANQMTELLTISHEILDAPMAIDLPVSKLEIELCNVRFGYSETARAIFPKLSLKITAGECVGIVGPSGGGKSTLLKLLARLYDIQEGNILIGGIDIRSLTQESLHRSIAYVPQEPTLFHRNIIENIRYAKPSATLSEVIDISKLTHCHQFIMSLPEGYETVVGERGVKLSGGERQRIAIARALLMDAPIILLDEATSSLDSESEMYIQQALERLVENRTVVAIAHRLSTLRRMDRIFVLKDGKIVEEGNHEVLMSMKHGVYHHAWNLQSFLNV
jgi:ATP-binding cassette, subfamily B, bacterial